MTHSCALVTSDGSIDWLCWPRHDSPAVFTRLLDDSHGGCATVHIDGAAPASRGYRGETAILETRLRATGGEAAVIDWMPIAPPAARTDDGPDGEAQSRLVRLVECRDGCVSGSLRVRLTPGYRADAAMMAAQELRPLQRWPRLRSALTLKLLTYSPTGAIIAAATK